MTELLFITQGANLFHFNDGDETIKFFSIDYVPAVISRSPHKESSLEVGHTTTFYFARGNEFADLYEDTAPLGEVIFQVFSIPEGRIIIRNRVIGARWVDNTLEVETAPAPFISGQTVRGSYGRQCRWAVYSEFCSATPTWIQATFNMKPGLNIVRVITSDYYAEDFFSGGIYAPNQTPTEDEKITVLKSLEAQAFGGLFRVDLVLNFVPETPPSTGWLARGCDKTRATCAATFSNIDNFGGIPELK